MRVSFQQGLGRINREFHTCLIWWDRCDSHFFHRQNKERCNWMPKHGEVELLLESLLQVEGPAKREKLALMFHAAIERGMASEVKYNP